MLAADTRATMGTVVGDKNCAKIHYIAPNIWCCGAGTAADTEFTTCKRISNIILPLFSIFRIRSRIIKIKYKQRDTS